MRMLHDVDDLRAEIGARHHRALLEADHARARRDPDMVKHHSTRAQALAEAVDIIESYRHQRRDGVTTGGRHYAVPATVRHRDRGDENDGRAHEGDDLYGV